jgi:hypothetical protein
MPATTLEDTLFDLLSGAAALTSLVGSGDDARIFPLELPQGQKQPCIVFRQEDAERPPCFGQDSGICRSLYEFECWSATEQAGTPKQAQDIAEALRGVLQRYRDLAGANGVVIQDCFLQSQSEWFDPGVQAHKVVVIYQINWEEPT